MCENTITLTVSVDVLKAPYLLALLDLWSDRDLQDCNAIKMLPDLIRDIGQEISMDSRLNDQLDDMVEMNDWTTRDQRAIIAMKDLVESPAIA